jgi:hypothetical protein
MCCSADRTLFIKSIRRARIKRIVDNAVGMTGDYEAGLRRPKISIGEPISVFGVVVPASMHGDDSHGSQ